MHIRSYVITQKLSYRFLKDNRGSSAYSFDPLFLLGNIKLSTWNKFDVYMVIPVVDFTDDTAKSKENHGVRIGSRNTATCPRHTV